VARIDAKLLLAKVQYHPGSFALRLNDPPTIGPTIGGLLRFPYFPYWWGKASGRVDLLFPHNDRFQMDKQLVEENGSHPLVACVATTATAR